MRVEFGLFLMFAVILSTTVLGMPQTAQGTHCPTAPVQSVVRVTVDKNCCANPVNKTVTRKPREGEPEFKQCRCAERSASDSQKHAKVSSSWRQIQLAILSPTTSRFSIADIGSTETPFFWQLAYTPPPFDPATPPPQYI